MMQQYFEIKEQYKDHLLFYRLGDFYEMFFDDAKCASKELDLTLTGRDCGMPERAPMCGVPFHSADSYIAKLVAKGYKIAICEQTEDPAQAKGLVKREVIRVITPGTVTESGMLSEGKNNYLCAVCISGASAGLAFADISTAQVYATQITDDESRQKLLNELAVYAPKEMLVNADRTECPELLNFAKDRLGAFFDDTQPELFDTESFDKVVKQFGEEVFEKNLLYKGSPVTVALGALLEYLRQTQKMDLEYIDKLEYYTNELFLGIDVNTRRSLELCETMRSKEKKGTLLWVLDKTKTAMGARLLRKWVEQPLMSVKSIVKRQQAVSELYDSYIEKEEMQNLLSSVNDLERLMTKIVYNTAGGKDLRALYQTIIVLGPLKAQLESMKSKELCELCESLDTLDDIGGYIDKAIVEDPPFSIREGGFIKKGFSSEIDELNAIQTDGKSWIAGVEQSERELTGIKGLKIGYNRVFGYYIEVTNSYKDLVPDRYIRKQTLTGCERFITQELKDMEAKILGARDKVCALEYEAFQTLREYIAQRVHRVQKTADVISKLDVYISLADVAKRNNYCCPEVDNSDVIEIHDGRHPVVERYLKNEMFVPNDVNLDENNRLMLITGPNMAGKSTYMRQTALIILMAQIGSFVPAKSARIGVVDKIFTRIGASDDLAAGQSTFMLEMTECAYILKNATSKSFILYDEIGRGTSTYDGMSIARAIIEYTVSKKLYAKTMFATHYHELTELEDLCRGVVNYNIVAKKRGDELIFLRKIVRGATDDSYGIEVAKLAGVPDEVVKRADKILSSIDEHQCVEPKKSLMPKHSEGDNSTLTLKSMIYDEVCENIKKTDINTLTPIEALTKFYEIKKILGGVE